jgi:hypothetical protein
MIAEVFPKAYDVAGHPVVRPLRWHYSKFAPTFPMGRYVSQPLTVACRDLDEIREFLRRCRYVSDRAQFGRPDYWMPPEEFESRRQGDCEDFALWTWRQLMRLGYLSRFVCGYSGRYGAGHAWVTFEEAGRAFIVESLAADFGATFPRLLTLRYEPAVSVAWNGRTLNYFEHRTGTEHLTLREMAPHLPEWMSFHVHSVPRTWLAGLWRAYAPCR